ncbi:MAG TPA: RnfABCDGE type electron transport complex subunit B [Clostridiales bacterium]|jgi:Na+-translocating ferredoxin:NAD+ oxidoreductase RNF subunit RnfB|nr:RnfABCDGE type electron transport complex subunit B [Clostridiales bacterium]
MTNVIYAVAVLGLLGAFFGLVLAFAARKFAVEVDERQLQVEETLPGANCGGCGYAGCAAYAAAIVNEGAPINLCVAGGSQVIADISHIMGIESAETERFVAHVRCSGCTGIAREKFEYDGIPDCVAAMRLGGGQGFKECSASCLGLGTCVRACQFDAIHIIDGVAVVDHEKCVGCMACAEVCPKDVIEKIPYSANITVPCNSLDKGPVVRKYCDVGCIACKICERVCEYDAIHVTDNLAHIDYDKCVSCGKCVEKCPRNLILDIRTDRKAGEPSTANS